MKNTRGLSTVVTTLIIVLLVLVALTIVWTVIRNIVEDSAAQTDIKAKCLTVDVRVTNAVCDEEGICDVTIARGAGTGDNDLGGVYLKFSEGTETNVVEQIGNIDRLDSQTYEAVDSMLIPDKVEAFAYFVDDSGNAQPCDAGDSFTIETA